MARSSSGTISGGIGRPMSSSAVQPKMRSEAGFQMVTVRSSVNACVASGDASTIADSSVLVRSSRASAAFRAAISDCDASSAVRRLVVARQPSASAKAMRAVNDAMVMPVAVPMNRTCAGPTRTASATLTLATTTAAIDASRSCAESSEPWMRATLIRGATTATAMPSGSTAPATSASTLMATAAANRNVRRQMAAPSSVTITVGSTRPARIRPGRIAGLSARLTTAPMSATTGAPTSATRSHTCSRGGSTLSDGIRDDMARRRGTISILRGAAATTGQPRPA